MELPRIRYARTHDDLSIAYFVLGRGERNMVFIMGAANHLEFNWEMPSLQALYRRLAAVGRLAVFDKRGLGLSDRHLGVGTLEERMDDVRSVMDAAGFAQADLIGASEGGAMAILFAATYPQRVRRLVLFGAFPYGGGLDDTHDNDLPRLIEASWGTGSAMRTYFGNYPNDPSLLERFERNVATPRGMAELVRRNCLIDVSPVLADVRVPTLVIHDRRDPVVPFEAGCQLAERIPGAKLVELDNGYHWGWREHDNDVMIDEAITFLTGERPPTDEAADRVLATVLFTDIVQSTELANQIGDQRWRGVLDGYESRAINAVRHHRGRWVKSTGDGVLASFDGPGRAIACAKEIRTCGQELGLATRSGLHTGEVEERGDDIAGVAVHTAARIVAAAAPGEIWVSATIPGLVVGSPVTFETRGEHQLKGLVKSMELFAAT
jgi:pimeloyl-ACP methyl ester carboxylesterase